MKKNSPSKEGQRYFNSSECIRHSLRKKKCTFVNLFAGSHVWQLLTGAHIAYPMSIGSDMCANAFELVAHCHPRHVPFVGCARNTGWLVNLGSIIASRRAAPLH